MAYSRQDIETAFPGGKWSNGEYLIKSPLRPEERTASFRINPEKASYFDFGSGQGGKLSELFALTGQDDPFHGEGGTPIAPRSREAEEAIIKRQAAINLWEAAGDPAGHPYLLHKGVEAYGARRSKIGRIWKDGQLKELTGDFLVIPAYGPDGSMVGIEQITPSGRPKYDLGEKGVFVLGEHRSGVPLLVAEGYSTAASLKKISGWNVACAFGTGNIRRAVENLRKQFTGDIIVTPDTGAEDFTDVADVVEIPGEHPKNTDWNDLVSALGVEQAKDLFREAWAKTRKMKEPVQAEKVEEKPKIRLKKFNAVDLYRANLRSPSWAIDQLIPEGLSVVASPPKVGKSYFVLQAAIAVARGVPFLGQRTTKGPVLLLSLEDTEIRLRKRLVQVIPDLRDIPENLDMMTEFPRLDQEGLATLDDEIKRNGYRLVIIDTWGKTKPVGQTKRGENVYETDVRLVSEVKKIADRYETSIILVHHLKKGGSREPDWLESLSGSMGLSATVDGLLAIERDRKAVLGILKRTGRDLEDDEDIGLKWLQPGWEFNGDAREMMQSAARKEILSSIARAKEPVTPKYVVLDTGGKDSTIRVHLMNMKNAGLVAVTSDGKYYIPQKEEPSDDNVYPVNSLNALNGLNAVNGLNGLNVYGAEDALNAPVNAINPSDTNDSDGGVYGVYGVYDKRTTGNLEPFFPGGLKTGISSPRGYSVSELASRAGVSEGAVLEELSRWEECKRVSVDGDKIILLEGDSYPGQDEPEPEEESPPIEPNEPPSAGPVQGGLFQDETDAEPLTLDQLEAWAASVSPGMTARLKAKARRDKASYEALLRQEYASSMEGEQGPTMKKPEPDSSLPGHAGKEPARKSYLSIFEGDADEEN